MDWKKALRAARTDPLKVPQYLLGALYRLRLLGNRRVRMGQGVRLIGVPLVDLRGNSRLVLGNGVLLNSSNRGYFAALYGPVKLFADHDGASITIGDHTRIHGSCIHAYNSVSIGRNCLIAANTVIVDSDGHDPFPSAIEDRLPTQKVGVPVVIEDNVWIGMNCIILKGVCIGTGSVIGAGSVVRRSIPPFSLASGNPSTVVRRVEAEPHPGLAP